MPSARSRRQAQRVLETLSSLAFILLLFIAQAPAQTSPVEFRVGLQSINIPRPDSELVEAGPDYRSLAEPLAPASNRLVAAFLLPADLKTTESRGALASLTRYALVESPRRAEFTDITPALFKQVNDGINGQFGATLADKVADQQKEIDQKLKALTSQPTSIKLEKPVMLGSHFSKPDAVGYSAIMPLSVNGTTRSLAMGMAVIRVHQRLLFLYAYAPYLNQDSVTSVQTITERWSTAILKANPN